jgi:hypothetical protein
MVEWSGGPRWHASTLGFDCWPLGARARHPLSATQPAPTAAARPCRSRAEAAHAELGHGWEVDMAGLGWAGLGWAGLGWAGLGWAGLRWAGLGWAGLGWAGLGCAGLGWAGLGWAGPGRAGLGWPGTQPRARAALLGRRPDPVRAALLGRVRKDTPTRPTQQPHPSAKGCWRWQTTPAGACLVTGSIHHPRLLRHGHQVSASPLLAGRPSKPRRAAAPTAGQRRPPRAAQGAV